MENNCYFTDEQKRYIFKFLMKRQEKLSQKAKILDIARKTEGSLSSRQQLSEKKILEELTQIHLIVHELAKDDFMMTENNHSSEREEAVNIAQAYKAELDRIEISDEDIEHLHNTVSQALEILNGMSEEKLPVEEIKQLKELISVDALKTMQLLGFNYKAAIGEPLTDICAQKIKQWGGVKTNQSNGKKNK